MRTDALVPAQLDNPNLKVTNQGYHSQHNTKQLVD